MGKKNLLVVKRPVPDVFKMSMYWGGKSHLNQCDFHVMPYLLTVNGLIRITERH